MIKATIHIDKEQIHSKLTAKVVDCLTKAGELCIAEARTSGSYTDRTGNLRNSVGYVVLVDGKTERQANINALNAKQVNDLAPKYRSGIVLIVVAGMKYAAYVEAKGYNVLTSAELLAEKIAPQLLSQLH